MVAGDFRQHFFRTCSCLQLWWRLSQLCVWICARAVLLLHLVQDPATRVPGDCPTAAASASNSRSPPTSKQHKFAVPKHSRSKHQDYFFHASFCDGKFCFFLTRFDVRIFSLSVLLFPSSPSARHVSAFYSSAASDFHCCGPQPVAAAKARCMCWVIMSQPALGLAAGTSSRGPMAAADHRPTKAASVIARCKGRAVHARDRANHRTKLAASALQLPPTSMPSTTKRHRDARPISNDAPVIPALQLGG